jgi:hypothetical protein
MSLIATSGASPTSPRLSCCKGANAGHRSGSRRQPPASSREDAIACLGITAVPKNNRKETVMRIRSVLASSTLVSAMMLSTAAGAGASTNVVSFTAGPVAIPNVPVQVCANGSCAATPALSSVALTARATVDTGDVNATITPGTCAMGVGALLTVKTGGTPATVSGTVAGTLPGGSPFQQAIGPFALGANSDTTLSACTSVTSTLPGSPLPTGVLGTLLGLVKGLFGGLLPLPTLPGGGLLG